MGLIEQKCHILACDRCGAICDAGDFVPHFKSEEEARHHFEDNNWQYDEEAKQYLCPDCPLLRPPSYWEKELGLKVYDPDGWRADGKSFSEPISQYEFEERAFSSTTQLRPAKQEATA